MNTDTRRAITQARFTMGNSKLFSFQLLMVAAIIGATQGSWWWFIVSFFAICFCCAIPIVAISVVLLLSSAWGIAGYSIAASSMNIFEAGVIGLIAFVVGLGFNLSGLTGLTDQY